MRSDADKKWARRAVRQMLQLALAGLAVEFARLAREVHS
jgi:hypothetical protein